MEMGLPSRPRLIYRLRLVKILRTHMGEDDAISAAEAIQDECSTATTHHDIQMLMIWMRAELNALATRVLLGVAVIGGFLLSAAKLF